VSEGEKRRIRRALCLEDLKRLLKVTEQADAERALLYRLAVTTGLRKNELRTLQVRDFSNDCLHLAGKNAKNRKQAVIPLMPSIAMALTHHIRGKKTDEKLIYVSDRVHESMKQDLKRAKIPYTDADGRFFDFHSLRKQTATLLALAGVHPRVTQQVMRHSSIDLTMGTYTDASLLPVKEAVERLPAF